MKHGKKHFVLDENRRNTYNPSSAAREESVLNTFNGERKHLLTVRILYMYDNHLILSNIILKLLGAISLKH